MLNTTVTNRNPNKIKTIGFGGIKSEEKIIALNILRMEGASVHGKKIGKAKVVEIDPGKPIPAHLLSREALEIYQEKLKPDGIVAFHVSNRYLRVRELVSALAIDAGLPALVRSDDDDSQFGKARSVYVIVARAPDAFGVLRQDPNWEDVTRPESIEPWTDDYSNLWSLLRWQ